MRSEQQESWYYRCLGLELGPLPITTLIAMIERGELGADDVLRPTPTATWRRASEVPALRQAIERYQGTTGSEVSAAQKATKPDEWYYEIDGLAHGPLRRAELDEFLSPSGESALNIRIRQGRDGDWQPFRPSRPAEMSSSAVALATDCFPGPDREAREDRPHQRAAWPTAPSRGWFRQHADLSAGLGAWVLANVVLLLFWPQSYSRERRYLEILKQMDREAQELRIRDADGFAWEAFVIRSQATLAPMVKDLKKSANAYEPIRQHLLWAARDSMPKSFGPVNKQRQEQRDRLQQHLQMVETQLPPP